MTAPTVRPTAVPHAGEPDLLPSDVEDSLRASVRELLARRCPTDKVIPVYDGDTSVQGPLWQALSADLGLAALLVPEELGGAGASAREAAVVLEELGRAAAPVPFLTSAVVATTVLLSGAGTAGAGEEMAALLGRLAAGESTAALLVPFAAAPFSYEPSVTNDGGLSGRVTSVAGALEADVLLVPAASVVGTELHLVRTADVRLEPVVSLDMTRQLADVDVTGAPSVPLIQGGSGAAALREALLVGAALMASEQVGVAQWCLETTVAYLKQRKQFGRVVGGFQALKHRLADLYVTVESASAAARYAAATVADGDPDREVAASVAQAYCSPAAVSAAEEAVQLHGGIGMTWEHPAHLFLKRAKADSIGLGTAGAHRRHLAELVDLPLS
ncbi:MAG: acyl-CoA dehydrogenase family protein [Motilibacteraceae bacterium]